MNIAVETASSSAVAPHEAETGISQVAALCHREGDDGIEILLITSSNGRWILPKGWPMDDRSDAKAAKQEAWEEAGVKKGNLESEPVGTYVANKVFEKGGSVRCDTTVYAIEVTQTVKAFPEAKSRKRKWVALDDAPNAVDDPALASFLADLRLDAA